VSAALHDRNNIEAAASQIRRELSAHVADGGRLALVKAPPGSGKTSLLIESVVAAYQAGRRVAIAAQTNSQVDDICRRLAHHYPGVPAVRFARDGQSPIPLGPTIRWETRTDQLPPSRCVVVATAAKWALVSIHQPFAVLFIDEAWQLSWADFMLLGQVSERFVMIGDPGQISPVVSIDVSRWETSPRPPHIAAPQVILGDPGLHPEQWTLPASRRLPSDSVGLVKPFYDFDFGAYARAGERAVLCDGGGRAPADQTLDLLRDGSVAALTIPTDDSGPPLERDEELAELASTVVRRLMTRGTRVRIGGDTEPLRPEHIGLVATHRVMNTALELALPQDLRGRVQVDTPERWQGLERRIMIVVHPLSGVVRPSAFDLATERLCVMASRHLAGMIVLSRDHLRSTLDTCIPSAEQPVGRPDVTGRGLRDNLTFWESLEEQGRTIAA